MVLIPNCNAGYYSNSLVPSPASPPFRFLRATVRDWRCARSARRISFRIIRTRRPAWNARTVTSLMDYRDRLFVRFVSPALSPIHKVPNAFLAPLGWFKRRPAARNASTAALDDFRKHGRQSQSRISAGYYSSYNGSTVCFMFQRSLQFARRPIGLHELLSGYYSTSLGSISCQACPLGSFNDDQASTDCSLCPINHYSNSPNSTLCQPCLNGYVTNGLQGSTVCISCEAGTVAVAQTSKCIPCDIGQISGIGRANAVRKLHARIVSIEHGSEPLQSMLRR